MQLYSYTVHWIGKSCERYAWLLVAVLDRSSKTYTPLQEKGQVAAPSHSYPYHTFADVILQPALLCVGLPCDGLYILYECIEKQFIAGTCTAEFPKLDGPWDHICRCLRQTDIRPEIVGCQLLHCTGGQSE